MNTSKDNSKIEKAINILKSIGIHNSEYIGKGQKSIVFSNNNKIYKVVLDQPQKGSYQSQMLLKLYHHQSSFLDSKFFYPIEIIETDSKEFVISYPFEQSTPCLQLQEDEIQDFLVECWTKKLIFQDIRPQNFIRVDDALKWIDFEPDLFTDNLFMNMISRAFIYVRHPKSETSFIKKLQRSAINQPNLPELNGLQAFSNRVFTKIMASQFLKNIPSSPFQQTIPYQPDLNLEHLFWTSLKNHQFIKAIIPHNIFLDSSNYFSPNHISVETNTLIPPKQPVSLIVKSCAQDSPFIYTLVKNIIKQLLSPNYFDEIILALDIRQEDFLREFNATGSWEELLEQTERLQSQGIINKIIWLQEDDIQRTNLKWFQLQTDKTHSISKVPVTYQLFAFDQAKNDYILQVDSDVMIGRLNREHSFLNDMILELEQNPNVCSVGFNIYKGKDTTFTPYFGFKDGGFVPEVRCCLLQRSRIEAILPLPNQVENTGFSLSWYRSLEQHQKITNTCSIRGGSSESFYIHPPNLRKTDPNVWFFILDRVRQLQIPTIQINQFDVVGSFSQWNTPKRTEEVVIVSCFRNLDIGRFLRYWYSLLSQDYQDWGLILIDDASDNGLSLLIQSIIHPHKDKITFIKNFARLGVGQNTFTAIRKLMDNPQSVALILDADDAFLHHSSISNCMEKYEKANADVVIGKMYRTDKLSAHYPYTPNFVSPRLNGGNVWQHIRSFKKYLYDSLSLKDLQILSSNTSPDDILLSKRFRSKYQFPEHCVDLSYMVPIVEMSENPMFLNSYSVFHDRTTPNTPEIRKQKDEIIKQLLAKPNKSTKDIILSRRRFIPNLQQIEIDITYDCNLKCLNCNRSCTQAPTSEGMTLSQIKFFIEESIQHKKTWNLINLLGGEPTLHPDFLEIVTLLLEYINNHSSNTTLQVTSNGFGDFVQNRLQQLPSHPNLIIDYASFKDSKVTPYFSAFNQAPIDREDSSRQEYDKGCWVTSYCGIGLNHMGYYPCSVAGGIDRIFQKNLGKQSLSEVTESIAELLNEFCRYCGNFSAYESNQGDFIPRSEKDTLQKSLISPTWKKQYRKYNRNM